MRLVQSPSLELIMIDVSLTRFLPANRAHHILSAILMTAPQTIKIASATVFCILSCSINSRPASAIQGNTAVLSRFFRSSSLMACSNTDVVSALEVRELNLRRSSIIGDNEECGRLGHSTWKMPLKEPCCIAEAFHRTSHVFFCTGCIQSETLCAFAWWALVG